MQVMASGVDLTANADATAIAGLEDNYRAEQTRIPVSMERRAATATGVAQQSRCRFLDERITPAGFRGGLNWYRNIGRNWELLAPFDGLLVSVPALHRRRSRSSHRIPGMDGHISPNWRSSCRSFAVPAYRPAAGISPRRSGRPKSAPR